jgi:hypothetical protein
MTVKSVVVTFAFLSLPASLQAMPFSQFDKMSIYAQAEFIAVMIDTTENALRSEGQADLANRVDKLFREIQPGDKISLGIGVLAQIVARARLADLQRVEKDPQARRLEVEDALVVTLRKQPTPIELPKTAFRRVLDALASFRPQSYAEFQAKSPAEQRRTIRFLVGIGFQDYTLREQIKSKRDTFFGLGEEGLRDLADVVAKQFPSSGEQPGFAEVARRIDVERRKAPDRQGVFLTVTIYILDQLDARLAEREKQLDKGAIVIPRRR